MSIDPNILKIKQVDPTGLRSSAPPPRCVLSGSEPLDKPQFIPYPDGSVHYEVVRPISEGQLFFHQRNGLNLLYCGVDLLGKDVAAADFVLDSSLNNYSMSDFNSVLSLQYDTAIKPFGLSSLRYANSDARVAWSGQPIGSQSFTLEFYAYVPATGARLFTCSRDANSNTGFSLTHYDSLLRFSFGGLVRISAAMALNSWTHIAVVGESGSTIRLYVNGNLAGTTSYFYNFTSTTYRLGTDFTSYSGVRYLSNFRNTIGVMRYTANFTPPSDTFPTSVAEGDPYYNQVDSLLQLDGDPNADFKYGWKLCAGNSPKKDLRTGKSYDANAIFYSFLTRL